MSDPLMPTVEVERNDTGAHTVKVVEANHEVIATPLTGFLQISNPSPKERDMLKEVWDYIVAKSPSDLRTEQLFTLRNIEQRLSAPRLGQTRLDQLHQYISVDKQVQSAEKLRDSMLR